MPGLGPISCGRQSFSSFSHPFGSALFLGHFSQAGAEEIGGVAVVPEFVQRDAQIRLDVGRGAPVRHRWRIASFVDLSSGIIDQAPSVRVVADSCMGARDPKAEIDALRRMDSGCG